MSIDLRKRALALYDAGHKTAEVVRRLSVSPAWARRQKQRRREGRPIAAGVGTGRRPLLDKRARDVLCGWVRARPDATLQELRRRLADELGLTVSIGTVWNALAAEAFTLKKSR